MKKANLSKKRIETSKRVKENATIKIIEMIVFAILLILLMYISVGHIIKLPSLPYLDIHADTKIYVEVVLVLSTLFLIYGRDILKNGYKNLIHRTPNIDTLVGISVISTFLYSYYNAVKAYNGGIGLLMNLHFESVAILIYFVKLGRFIEERSLNKTKKDIQKLIMSTSKTKSKQSEIKVDGEVLEKESIAKEIKRFVVNEKKNKTVLTKMVDKLSRYFVPIVIILSIITFLVYFLIGEDMGDTLRAFIRVLVIACPCILGLVTPLSIVRSKRICKSKGILIKKDETLENIQKVGTIVFCNTEILKYGKQKTKEVIKELTKNGIETVMLIEDNKEIEEKTAKEIGITKTIISALPLERAKTIKRLVEKNKKRNTNKLVMVCGNRIDDCPALISSDIGVSMNLETNTEIDSSDVILTQNNLNSILDLIGIGQKTFKNIKQNLFLTFFYNYLMMPIAVGALRPFEIAINPTITNIVMVVSMITVVLNTLRLKDKTNKKGGLNGKVRKH